MTPEAVRRAIMLSYLESVGGYSQLIPGFRAISASQNRSGAPAGLSPYGSQAEPPATIARGAT